MKKMRVYTGLVILTLFLSFCDTVSARGLLKVAFLSIGQGDAIYIEAPNGNQMIIDGGPAGSLTGPLSDVMPFSDRDINVIMVTNPDADHYAGFIEMLKEYDVGAVILPGTITDTVTYAEFMTGVAEKKIPEVFARKEMTIDLDTEDGVQFRVLFPDRDVSAWASNDGSIEGILSYGTTKIMFAGDGTKKTESIILSENTAESLKSDIFKAPHHGSATSSSDAFVSAVAPAWAVISAGLHNKYGLPKQVTLDTFARHGVQTVRTDEVGTIIFTSDGHSFKKN